MGEEQTSYKVTDRRLFNPDGTPREVPEDERPETIPARAETASAAVNAPSEASTTTVNAPPDTSATAEAAAAGRAVETPPPQTSVSEEPVRATAESEGVELPGAEDPASFASFMMSIASNAASSLGMMEHPVTGKREVDLELGKHWIDVLGMLQKKTRGNLLPQEQQILEGLLADLRMQYVSLTNAAPKARTFSSSDITGG
jgi:hypothetical protein